MLRDLCRILTHQEDLGNGRETRSVQSTRKEPIHRAPCVILQFSEYF